MINNCDAADVERFRFLDSDEGSTGETTEIGHRHLRDCRRLLNIEQFSILRAESSCTARTAHYNVPQREGVADVEPGTMVPNIDWRVWAMIKHCKESTHKLTDTEDDQLVYPRPNQRWTLSQRGRFHTMAQSPHRRPRPYHCFYPFRPGSLESSRSLLTQFSSHWWSWQRISCCSCSHWLATTFGTTYGIAKGMIERQRRGDIVALLPRLQLAAVDVVVAHAYAKPYAAQAAKIAGWTAARAEQTKLANVAVVTGRSRRVSEGYGWGGPGGGVGGEGKQYVTQSLCTSIHVLTDTDGKPHSCLFT